MNLKKEPATHPRDGKLSVIIDSETNVHTPSTLPNVLPNRDSQSPNQRSKAENPWSLRDKRSVLYIGWYCIDSLRSCEPSSSCEAAYTSLVLWHNVYSTWYRCIGIQTVDGRLVRWLMNRYLISPLCQHGDDFSGMCVGRSIGGRCYDSASSASNWMKLTYSTGLEQKKKLSAGTIHYTVAERTIQSDS